MSIHSSQFIHVNSFMSIHSSQFIHVNSFMSIHSSQLIHVNSCVSIHAFAFLHFNSFVSIHSFQFIHVNSFISILSCQFTHFHSFQFMRFNSFISNHSCQLIHVNSFISCISCHFNSLLFNSPWTPISHVSFFEASALARAGHYCMYDYLWWCNYQRKFIITSIIMSTTSSCQSHHHQVVGKCERAGTREFTDEKTLVQNPVFSGQVAARGRRWRVSVSTVSRLDPESGRQNVNETVARTRFHIKITWEERTEASGYHEKE